MESFRAKSAVRGDTVGGGFSGGFPINTERFVCIDCGALAPESASNDDASSLISLEHGWRLRRRVDEQGAGVVEARCAPCHARFKAKPATGKITSFRAKGLVFQGAREFYAQKIPGGSGAVRTHLDRGTAAFFDQPFLGGTWYDVAPILTITTAAARAAGTSFAQMVRANAEWQAQRDLHGIYRLVVAAQSVESVAQKLPALSLQYFDFGRAEGKMIGARTYEAVRSGVPAPLAEWFDLATTGFVPVALGAAGARNVKVQVVSNAPDGELNGTKLLRTKYEIGWA